MDCNLPGSSVYGISQARILERVAISSSRGSFWLRGWTCVYGISCIGRRILYHWATWEAHNIGLGEFKNRNIFFERRREKTKQKMSAYSLSALVLVWSAFCSLCRHILMPGECCSSDCVSCSPRIWKVTLISAPFSTRLICRPSVGCVSMLASGVYVHSAEQLVFISHYWFSSK